MQLGSLKSTQDARVVRLTLLSCSPNFSRVSITRYTDANHEPILNSRKELVFKVLDSTYQFSLIHT